jgi:flagellin
MSLFINTNIWSLNAQRALALSQADLTRSLERLSTQLRINRASDDPVGNAVVERYTAQINGIDQARRNISHGTIFSQHADSNLESVNDQLLAIREKIVASNGTVSDPATLAGLQDEIKIALSEVERLVQSTEFDGRKILNGTSSNTLFQVGPNAADTVGIATGDFRTDAFGLYRLKGNPTGHSNHAARGGAGEFLTLKGTTARTVYIAGSPSAKASAYEIASAANGVKGATGIGASARTDIEITNFKDGGYTFSIESKNIADTTAIVTANVGTAPGGGVTGIAAFGGLINSINALTNKTGVEASLNGEGDGILLTNDEGYNVTLVFSAAAENLQFREPTLSRATSTGAYFDTLGTVGTTPVSRSFTGQVIFDSQRPFSVLSDLDGTGNYPPSGITLSPPVTNAPTVEQNAALVSISDIDVTGNTAVSQILSAQKTGTALPANLGIPKSTAVPVTAVPVVSESWVLQGAIRDAFAVIDYAMAAVATQQATFGSAQNQLNAINENLGSDFDNLSIARGYIQDADIALETSIQTRASIQLELNIAILGQANALQQAVLALLR